MWKKGKYFPLFERKRYQKELLFMGFFQVSQMCEAMRVQIFSSFKVLKLREMDASTQVSTHILVSNQK
jgi:hypothetical protein